MNIPNIEQIVQFALTEDIGSGDITATIIPEEARATAKIICQQDAVICGKEVVNIVFNSLDPKVNIAWYVYDGVAVTPNTVLCEISGYARALLSGERTALNFLQTLSSTATLTRKYVDALVGTRAKLLDTRKTLPGLRAAQKYAVKCGGGQNHRLGLYDAILLKENHIAASGSITQAVATAKKLYPHNTIEVEVRNLAELQEALSTPIDIIMLDNFSLEAMRQAVKLNAGKIKLEASGGVCLTTIHEIALTGVDFISVGAITKTVIPIELTMLVDIS